VPISVILVLCLSLSATALFLAAVFFRLLPWPLEAKLFVAGRVSAISSAGALGTGAGAIVAMVIAHLASIHLLIDPICDEKIQLSLFAVVEVGFALALVASVGVDVDANVLVTASERPWLALRPHYMRRQVRRYTVMFQSEGCHEFSLHLRRAGLRDFFKRRLPNHINNADIASGAIALLSPSLLGGGARSIRIASPHIAQRTSGNPNKTARRMAQHFPGWRYEELTPRVRSQFVSACFQLTESDWSTAVSASQRLSLVRRTFMDAREHRSVFQGFRIYR
jgi:hypothetical protein